MESKTKHVLDIINEECGEGVFRILAVSEILAALPKSLKMDGEELADIVKYLVEHDYIKVKYSDTENICVTNTPKGRTVAEERRSVIAELRYRRRTIIITFFASFFGALAGSTIVLLVMELIKL